MSGYSYNERLIAKFLERFPYLRRILKSIYQRLVYLKNYTSYKIKITEGWVLEDAFPEIKGHTFFGYYDKSSYSRNGSLLTHAISNDTCSIYVRIISGELRKISETKAWNWQQGAMATWLNNDLIGFNDIEDGKVVFCIYSIKHRSVVNIFKDALQSYSFLKNFYISISYEKLNSLRPEYGYEKLTNTDYSNNSGIKILDITSGKSTYYINLDQVISFLGVEDEINNIKINHCQFSPNGNLVLFMYRAFRKDGKHSYLLIWDYRKNKLIKLMSDRVVSHYSWIDNNKIIVWGRIKNNTGYHIITTDAQARFLKFNDNLLLGDGHPSFCSNGNKIITDTYPDKARMSTLFLLSADNTKEQKLVQLKQPWKFKNSSRVDLHPRFNLDCNLITLESGHSGSRRQYILRKIK